MPLDLAMINCVVRIIGDCRSSDDPPRVERGPVCTGFVVHVPSETVPNVSYHYIVTAAHVILNQNRIEVQYADCFTGEFYDPIPLDNWTLPFDRVDLAIANSPPVGEKRVMSQPIDPEMGWSVERTPAPGTSVLYVGWLEPLNRTMVRSGTIGAPNQHGIPHAGGWEYDCHLLDCRSYGGFSGSPCYLDLPFPDITPEPNPLPFLPKDRQFGRLGHYAMFAGMITEHLSDPEDDSCEDEEKIPYSRYGVVIMLPADLIVSGLTTEEMMTARWEQDQRDEAARASEEPRLVETPRTDDVEAGLTDGELDDALRRATRVIPPDESAPEGIRDRDVTPKATGAHSSDRIV